MNLPIKKNHVVIRNDKNFLLDYSNTLEIPIGHHPGSFGYTRKHHIHEGIDLYCLVNEPVYAIKSGIVVSIGPFTGDLAGSPWWNDTQYLMVASDGLTLNYGEIKICDGINLGTNILASQLIGCVATVLKVDKGRPTSMLHLEMYTPGARTPIKQWVDLRPIELLDPTKLILNLANLNLK